MIAAYWPCVLVLACVITGCSGPGGHEAPSQRTHAPEAAQGALPVLPVDVLILTGAPAQDNALWEPQGAFLPLVLAHAAQALAGAAHLTLESVATFADPEGYTMEQWAVLRRYRHLRVPGRLLVVVSGPETRESAGFSYTLRTDAPYLVLRARWQDRTAALDTAHILLHELGHNLGLTHEGALHADNYSQLPEGLTALRVWLEEEVLR